MKNEATSKAAAMVTHVPALTTLLLVAAPWPTSLFTPDGHVARPP